MLSSAKIGTSSWRYYTAQVACKTTDYYLGAGEAPGRWAGRGLEALGLDAGSIVTEAQLESLFARAINPTTAARLGRAWRVDGVTGFDLTFSAPKSVSALWALGDPDIAAEVRNAHREAVAAAMAYLDKHASFSRRGMDGVEQIESAGLVSAVFEHRTSRSGDPQLHTHALVVNKVRCADGWWRTVDATEIFHHKKSAGVIYQAALRSELHARLGVVFSEVGAHGQAEILGIPAALLKLWSKRTAQIEPEAAARIAGLEAELGRTLNPAERAGVIKAAVLKTRPSKQHPDPSTLAESWAAEAITADFDPAKILLAVRDAASLYVTDPQPSKVLQSAPVRREHVRTPTDRIGAARIGAARIGADRIAAQSADRPVDPMLADLLAQVPPAPVAGHDLGADVSADAAAVAEAAVTAAASLRSTFSRADVVAQVATRLPVDGRGAMETLGAVEELADVALGTPAAVSIGEHPHGVTKRASDHRWAGAEVLAAEARVLSLAERGRAGGYGRARATSLFAALEGAGLDPAQQAAVRAIAEGGDFLSVLTAPAGAGKTRTLGVATVAWQQTGYRVIGLAPSARAAAELSTAIGAPADTLAKWVHDRGRRGLLPAQARARVALDARAVVIVDEASMANTHDLDTLITAAARAGTKVVLVGDPAQIGVVNGPGGLLAALAHAGHGVELDGVHRFEEQWERVASLALRSGYPAVIAAYQEHGRIHACDDAGHAVAELHSHWLAERAAGREVLMMARTRTDVDALNLRARASAQAAGEVHGPAITIGEREWQAGDLIRTRRNDRSLVAGEEHVRNGDRWRVIAPEADGLIVEHLERGDRALLPVGYVAAHAEYGWAATIDAAQGATVDVGLVLVRPGIDREHLYVALARGRLGNHAYVLPDPVGDIDHHGLPPVQSAVTSTPEERAIEVLAAGLSRSGAQDAAHTARDRARTYAAERARRADEDATTRNAQPEIPAQHVATAALLTLRQRERSALEQVQIEHRRAADSARNELAHTSRWNRSRRQHLGEVLSEHEGGLRRAVGDAIRLDAEIERLSLRVDGDTRQRQRDGRQQAVPSQSLRADATETYLAPAASEASMRLWTQTLAVPGRRRRDVEAARAAEVGPRRRSHRVADVARNRDDGPTLGR